MSAVRRCAPDAPGCSSGERPDTGDLAPDNEGLDGFGPLIGVQCLHVGHVPNHVEVEQDAVAAEQVPRLRDDLARLAGVVHLGDGSDRVGELAFVHEPAQS